MSEVGLGLIPLLALIGSVILLSSLGSGIVDRTGFPQVALFLILGLILGPHALSILDLPLHSPTLEVIATLALVLVLFTDAVTFDVTGARRAARVAAVVLGPGTLLAALINTIAARLLLQWSWPQAAITGAALASTDPVLLRSLLRHPRLPANVRSALRIEAGANDAVLLPIIALAIIVLGDVTPGAVGRRLLSLFILGPALGVLCGWLAIVLLGRVRTHWGVRRDYESLYALGIALSAFTVAEAVGGSGLLAAFAAGLIIAFMDVELCDCFHDYGEATAEMLLLLTFVAFGASLIWTGTAVISMPSLMFVAVALVSRTAVLFPALRTTALASPDRRLLAWLGPRGLSSLLLVMLAAIARVDGAEEMFAVTSLAVLISIVLHGGGILWLTQRGLRSRGPAQHEAVVEGVTIEQLQQWRANAAPHVLVDARAARSWETDVRMADGAVRLNPDEPVRSARELGLSHHATLVVYCA
jgi:NhaP-type Na+/H+ or K+/H+ antiporter